MRNLLFTLALALFAATTASAQSLDAFKNRLAAPVASQHGGSARVTVTESGNASRSVAQAAREVQRSHLRGYRVCIFFDNGQNARSSAVAAKTLFEETYPGIRVHLVYENPYFRVTVGNCLTIEEAIILKGRVSATFPKAFPKSEELSLEDLAEE